MVALQKSIRRHIRNKRLGGWYSGVQNTLVGGIELDWAHSPLEMEAFLSLRGIIQSMEFLYDKHRQVMGVTE